MGSVDEVLLREHSQTSEEANITKGRRVRCKAKGLSCHCRNWIFEDVA